MQSPPPLPSKLHRRRTTLLIVGIALSFPLLVHLAMRWQFNRMIDQHLAYFSTNGLPNSLSTLDAYYPALAPEDNAALALTNAFAQIAPQWTNNPDLPLIGRGRLPKRAEPVPTATAATIRECLLDNADALRVAREAFRRKGCRYPINMSEGWRTLLPHLVSARTFSHLFRLEALVAAQPVDAINSLEDLLRLEATLRNEPLLVSLLVRLRMRSAVLDATEWLLSRQALDDSQLLRLQTLLSGLWQGDEFARAMIGDVCATREFHDISSFKVIRYIDSLGGNAGWNPTQAPALGEILAGLPLAAIAFQDVAYQEAIKAHAAIHHGLQFDPPQRLELANAALAPMYRAKVNIQSNRSFVLAGMMLPGLHKGLLRDTASLARLRAAVTALAIERYRGRHGGQLPMVLNELTPDYPSTISLDPFNGTALRWKRLATGYMVYSVGSDQTDNGGLEFREPLESGYDETFVVER